MNRRSLLGLGAMALAAPPMRALAQAQQLQPADMTEIIPLWPGGPPGGANANKELSLAIVDNSSDPQAFHDRVVTGVANPTLSAFCTGASDGAAVLVLPGGGYRQLDVDSEGYAIARAFNAAGISAFVLLYRLPSEGWQDAPDVPLADAQRAIRLIRANAAHFEIDPVRTGVIGFSAGGHLAASLATRASANVYVPRDAADTESPLPAFSALIYPVITMKPPYAHEASREALLGERASIETRAAYSCEHLVTAATPPCFLAAAGDDPDVPVDNTLAMFASLRAARVPSEMHIFAEGGHGFGLATGKPAGAWMELLLHWGYARSCFRTNAAKP